MRVMEASRPLDCLLGPSLAALRSVGAAPEAEQKTEQETMPSSRREARKRSTGKPRHNKSYWWPPTSSPVSTVILSIALLLAADQFDAQATANDDVILSTAFNRTRRAGDAERPNADSPKELPSEPVSHHRFKYHLNHLHPPSLVPITIQQLSMAESAPVPRAERQGVPAERLPANTLAPGHSLHQSARLVQLQLPLQLHLKLKPLPLPMPPPAGRSGDMEEPVRATSARPRSDGERSHLLELTRRILMLSSMSPAFGQLKLNQRFANSPPPPQSPEERVGQVMESADYRSTGESARTRRTTSGSTATTAGSRSSSGQLAAETSVVSLAAIATTPLPASSTTVPIQQAGLPSGEVANSLRRTALVSDDSKPKQSTNGTDSYGLTQIRRQRHGSQQAQGHTEIPSETQLQAMAAAMLPFFWPSFQLADSRTTLSRREPANVEWPMGYTQLSRPTSHPTPAGRQIFVAESSFTPTFASVDNKTLAEPVASSKRSFGSKSKLGRNKRKKTHRPHQVPATTSYPDSTRMASKYPMPKIKFQPRETTLNPSKLADESASDARLSIKAQGAHVPKSLSKLIEQQLSLNVTSLLLQHKNQTRESGMAPTTSVSKVLRLVNSTDSMQIVIKSSESNSHSRLREQRTVLTTPAPAYVTSTTTTTTTTTSRPTQTLEPVTKSARPLFSSEGAPLTSKRSTESTGLYRSLQTPSSLTESGSTNKVDDLIGSNKVLPDEEEVPITTSTTRRPATLGLKKYGQQGTRPNIKLFHFKRKPDMNKLPFYKRPLNFTELRWTNEQIQEHLEAQTGAAGESEESQQEELLVRRKRRGKNQFERLMAELHGQNSGSAEQAVAIAAAAADRTRDMVLSDPGDTEPRQASKEEESLVPVIRKKTEQLVMKPMFFVMNQKRRPNIRDNHADLDSSSDEEPGGLHLNSSSKPIIRLRRKHHGEQPLLQSKLQTDVAPSWKPSEPLVWPITAEQRPGPSRLLLVSSGLLASSSSQLIPLYDSNSELSKVDEQSRFVNDFFTWRPAQQPTSKDLKPSGGLAPSGEESFLQAPSAPQESPGMSPDPSKQITSSPEKPRMEQVSGKEAGELRVPKLLIKPMRPAKYSLNGYIPRPTLGQQQQVPLTPINPVPPPVTALSKRPKASSTTGKDLDSSTSNEIFSRRRGLQQHQHSSASLAHESSSLSLDTGAQNQTLLKSAQQRQLEENRRKYVLQQQHSFKSPTISKQKANQIKAKLGLLASDGYQASHQPVASVNTIVTADPSIEHNNEHLDAAQKVAHQPIGAPLNSIPKTDFECTDKKGRFVAGLFADHKTGCQVWHLCSNNRKYSFLCPTGTIFSDKLRICDWRYNVKCQSSEPL